MNHSYDGIPHKTHAKCKYQHQFANQILYCRACFERGEEVPVTPKTYSTTDSTWMGIAKYAWAGFILECRLCGIIYRSRQYWYGNKDPTEQSVARTEILHVWDGVSAGGLMMGVYVVPNGSHATGRDLIDL